MYRIEYSPESEEHLRCLTKRQQCEIIDAVEERLSYEPDLESRGSIRFMKSIEIEDAKAPLAEYAREMRQTPFVLTEGGRPVAALIPIDNADSETVSLSLNPQFTALVERSKSRAHTEGTIPSDEMRKRLGL